jgi:hypothetical protein
MTCQGTSAVSRLRLCTDTKILRTLQLARRIERHAQHAQQLFDELITGRVIDEFGIRQRHLRRPGNQGAATRPRWLLPGHGDTQPFLGVDEVVIAVSTDVISTQLILPVNRLSFAV